MAPRSPSQWRRHHLTKGSVEKVKEAACRRAESLPLRPFLDPDGEYCELPGEQFSFVPRKHLAEMTLPPMQMRKSLTDRALGIRTPVISSKAPAVRHRGPPVVALPSHGRCRAGAGRARQIAGMASPMLNACKGDYCDADMHYPACLQDLETSEHPWMVQARKLCGSSIQRNGEVPLMSPEEMAACLESCSGDGQGELSVPTGRGAKYGVPPEQAKLRSAAVLGSPGDIQASWIFEARAYQRLARWMEQDANWMLNPNDPDQVAAASMYFHEDEIAGGGSPKFMAQGVLHGVRHRLRMVPVCGTCFCIYNSIHAAVVMMRVQHRDDWAQHTRRNRQERAEQTKKAKLERMISCERRGPSGHSFNVVSRCSSAGTLGATIRPWSAPDLPHGHSSAFLSQWSLAT